MILLLYNFFMCLTNGMTRLGFDEDKPRLVCAQCKYPINMSVLPACDAHVLHVVCD